MVNDYEWERGEKLVAALHETHPEMRVVPTMPRELCNHIKRLETVPLRIKEREQLERGLQIFIERTAEHLRSVRVREGDRTGFHQTSPAAFHARTFITGAKTREDYVRCPQCGIPCNIRLDDNTCYHCTMVTF